MMIKIGVIWRNRISDAQLFLWVLFGFLLLCGYELRQFVELVLDFFGKFGVRLGN